MRKLFFTVLIFSILNIPVSADETTFDDLAKTDFSHATQNLKHFSDKQFEEAIQQYKNKFQKPKKIKKKDIKTPTSVQEEGVSSEFQVLQDVINHTPVIMIPADCMTADGQLVSAGHYTMSVKFDENETPYIYLTQGSYKYIKIPAKNSAQNDKEETINYGYACGKGNTITLQYGNIDIAVEANLKVL